MRAFKANMRSRTLVGVANGTYCAAVFIATRFSKCEGETVTAAAQTIIRIERLILRDTLSPFSGDLHQNAATDVFYTSKENQNALSA